MKTTIISNSNIGIDRLPKGPFHGGSQQIPVGAFHGTPQKLSPGIFRATRKGSAYKTAAYTEPIRCRDRFCSKVFYTEYINGYTWECPFCGTIH